MNDRTIIRPGGRRPKKDSGNTSGNQPQRPALDEDNDRTEIASRRPDLSRNAQPAPAPDDDRTEIYDRRSEPPRGPSAASAQDDDRTEMRGAAPAGYAAPSDDDRTRLREPDQASRFDEAGPDDKTQFRPINRPGRPADRGGSEVNPLLSEIDEAFGGFDTGNESRRDGEPAVPQPRAPQSLPEMKPEDVERSLSTGDLFVKSSDALASDNGVVGLVSPLFVVVGRLHSVSAHPNLEDFKEYATECIRHYESISFGFGGQQGSKLSRYCSYALCCLVDELVLSTPWGMNSSWRDQGLLEVFHGDEHGDETFFQLLDELKEEPEQKRAALELFYLCLELGYEGKYRDMANGGRQIHDLRNQLFNIIEKTRGRVDHTLSEIWEAAPDKSHQLFRQIPIWVIFTVTVGILLATYAGFNIMLSRRADHTERALITISSAAPKVIPAGAVESTGNGPVSVDPDLVQHSIDINALKMLLFPEIDAGIVQIVDKKDAYILRLKNPGMFASGSDRMAKKFRDLVATIGHFLKGTTSPILVTGHTDDIPVRSIEYPSNWELSKARADRVRDILAKSSGLGSLIRSQGMADTDNIVPNNSPENRALNRRVEIQIKK